jgi:general secretion pathway protein C
MIIANMQTNTAIPWMPRLAAFGVALLLAGSVVFWVLRWPVADAGPPLPMPLASEDIAPVGAGVIARLLGAVAAPAEAAAAPDASSRFKLTGIVALGSGKGVALLSIDGKPA